MVASRDPENEAPGPADLYDVGVVGVVARMLKVPDGTIRILVQGTQRVRLGPYVAEEPYLVARISELPDAGRGEHRARGADPQRPAHLLGDHRADPVPARGAADGGRQHRRPGRSRLPDRRRPAHPDRGKAGAARGGRGRHPPAAALADPRPRARGRPARHPDPVPGPVRSRQRTARVLPPPAAESDPGRARRGRRGAGRNQRAARADRGGRAPRARAAKPPSASCRGWRNCPPRRPSTASSAPISSGWSSCPGRRRPTTTSTSATPARSSTPTTTTSSGSRTASSSTSRCAS